MHITWDLDNCELCVSARDGEAVGRHGLHEGTSEYGEYHIAPEVDRGGYHTTFVCSTCGSSMFVIREVIWQQAYDAATAHAQLMHDTYSEKAGN